MLKVNEIFGPTIQGEGKSVGKEVLFLRLATCNLHCVWCDTPYTWNWVGTPFAHPQKYDPKVEIHEMGVEDILKKLYELDTNRCRSLVISGGEPLIQWKQLLGLLIILQETDGWWVEVETNGTIFPGPLFMGLVDQINCSPKLSNSGDEKRVRVRPQALTQLVASPKVMFKFVIANEFDLSEVQEYVKTFSIPPERVYLMPLGKTQEELHETRTQTQWLCRHFGFNFSDRLHVVKFGGVRGV